MPAHENEDAKMLLDFSIHTDIVIEARRLNIVVVNKRNSEAAFINLAVLENSRVKGKKLEQIVKHQDLRR